MVHIQPYDLAMLALLLLAVVFGAWKGAAWQVASLASVLLGIAAALRFSGRLAPYISRDEWGRFAAMLILYVLASLAVWMAFRLVSGVIDRMRLRDFDRQLGALLGLAKGVLWCVVATFFVVTLSEPARRSIYNTYSARAIAWLVERTDTLLPVEVRQSVGRYLKKLDDELKQPPLEAAQRRTPGTPAPDGRLPAPPAA
jgi:membrane protein required for colicin V production